MQLTLHTFLGLFSKTAWLQHIFNSKLSVACDIDILSERSSIFSIHEDEVNKHKILKVL